MKKKWMMAGIVTAVIVILTVGIFLLSDASDSRKTDPTESTETAEKEVSLTMVVAYQNDRWSQAVTDFVTAFEAAYPNIHVELEIQYEDGVYEDRINRLIARDELGDIVQLKNPLNYIATGTIAEIPESVCADTKPEYRLSQDGRVYGVEAVGTTTGIVYNKQLFQQYGLSEPDDYEEFLEICSTLKKHGVTAVGVGGSDLWHMEFWVNHFFRTEVLEQKGDWLKDCQKGLVSWTDEEPQKMMKNLFGLFENGYVNSDWRTTADGELAYQMSEGNMAMVYSGSWLVYEILELNPEMELGWFYLPDEDGNVVVGENRDVYWSVTVECAGDPEKYEAAELLLNYFYSREQYEKICGTITGFPSTVEQPEITYMTADEKIVSDYYANEVHMADYIGDENTPQGFEKAMLETVTDALGGEYDSEGALAQIQQLYEQAQTGGTP